MKEAIFEIRDEDVGEEEIPTEYKQRNAVRAILKRDDKIAILNVKKHKYHKLPGGGIDEGESEIEAVHREIQEETGCTATIGEKIGTSIQYKSHQGKKQTENCYEAEVITEGNPEFTENEKRNGFELKWMTKEEAIQIMKKEKPLDYTGKFIVKRDLSFLTNF